MTSLDQVGRMEAVRRYAVLDTPPDGAFDRITALAAKLLSCPIAIVSIVDTDRIWFKSHHGLEDQQVDRDLGLCASAILQDEPWQISNARVDPRSLANPLVAGELGIQFYLGIPLTTHDGFNLGTLCVADREPREATEDDIATLSDLASFVVDELELRLSTMRVVGLVEQRLTYAEEDAEMFHRTADALKAGMESNRQIGKALGLLMAFHGITDDAAFEILRKASQDTNNKLNQIAEDYVEHHNERKDAIAI